ncbi:MAG: NADH-quinone oxidoreductase subunit N [Actinomycetota bacterium]|nr:NADH-quinone oxidoreductase subunit N [Acidimicrobiia bacterium]MDQ3293407.1 NADH-quinone oxidoreductase subunit N [Actinomycetota bacterium]
MLAQTAEPIVTPSIDWAALAPILSLVGAACVLLVVDALSLRKPRAGGYAFFTVLAAVASIITAVPLWREVTDPDRGPFTILQGALGGALGIDGFSVFFMFAMAASVILAALLADGYLRREGLDGPELYALVLLSASGGMVMASANDLIVTFLGLEILSIAAYVLSAMHLRRIQSQEAGIKYFVLGAFSSAFFLYGIALVYGATGSTKLAGIAGFQLPIPATEAFGASVDPSQLLSGTIHTPPLLLAGIGLLLVGFGFKIAAVPFHTWTPDVYQGAPSPAVVYMASGVKAAGFAGLLRVLTLGFGRFVDDWQPIIYGLAVATLLVGSILAVIQTDVKRLLAYSSISHAGFILVGVQAASERGVSGALFYLAAYLFMVAGSFGVITVLTRRDEQGAGLDDLRGLARRRPVLAFTFTVFLLAQAGVPLTSGFVAKFEVLAAAVEANSYYLAVVAMVSAVIAAYLYLKIVVAMYMSDPEGDEVVDTRRVPFGAKLALGVAAAATVVFGLLPGLLDDLSNDAVLPATVDAAEQPAP